MNPKFQFPLLWLISCVLLALVGTDTAVGQEAAELKSGNAKAVDQAEDQAEEKKADELKIAFLSGRPSHGYGSHEHYAGCMVLARALEQSIDGLEAEVFKHDWPQDEEELSDFDVIVMYCDGGGRHPVNSRLDQVQKLVDHQVGIVCIHYGVEVPPGESGDKFLEWIGGYFETHWSVNPHWTANFTEMPEHPITNGVNPFEINDEWYYHMRFPEGMERVTPILSAIPPKETLSRPDGAHSGNPHVRAKAGQPQHVAWALQREDGGRGFGFTGGHFHWNWGNKDFLRVVCNAIVWCGNAEVPQDGVEVEALTLRALKANQDFDVPENFDDAKVREKHGIKD